MLVTCLLRVVHFAGHSLLRVVHCAGDSFTHVLFIVLVTRLLRVVHCAGHTFTHVLFIVHAGHSFTTYCSL